MVTGAAPVTRIRAWSRRQWVLLGQFCLVGLAGFGVNLAVYALAVGTEHATPMLAAVVAFCAAVLHNYVANRYWTFRQHRAGFALQGARFLVVSLATLGLNLLILQALLGTLGEIPAQAIAVCCATPVSFLGNKLWSFRERGVRHELV